MRHLPPCLGLLSRLAPPTTQNKYQLAAQLHQHIALNTSAFKTDTFARVVSSNDNNQGSRQGDPDRVHAHLRPPRTQEAREPWAAVFSFGSLLALRREKGAVTL